MNNTITEVLVVFIVVQTLTFEVSGENGQLIRVN